MRASRSPAATRRSRSGGTLACFMPSRRRLTAGICGQPPRATICSYWATAASVVCVVAGDSVGSDAVGMRALLAAASKPAPDSSCWLRWISSWSGSASCARAAAPAPARQAAVAPVRKLRRLIGRMLMRSGTMAFCGTHTEPGGAYHVAVCITTRPPGRPAAPPARYVGSARVSIPVGEFVTGRAASCPPGTNEKAPAARPGLVQLPPGGSEAVQDLVGPEPLEPLQRLVQSGELGGVDAAHLLDRTHVLLVERLDDVAHLASLVGQLDAHGAAIDARALVVEEAHFDELLEIVRDVGAEIVAARAQLAGGQLLLADVEQKQRLHCVDVGAAAAVELVLDDVEQAAMQPLDQSQSLEIVRLDMVEARLTISGFGHVGNILHGDAPI